MEPHRISLIFCFTAVLLCYASSEEEEMVRAREGDTITLNTTEAKCDRGAEVVWTFGPEQPNTRIARVKGGAVKMTNNKTFRDRLLLDPYSGSLSITQVQGSDAGVFMCKSIGSNIFSQQFNLIVYPSVCAPSIMINSSVVNRSCHSLTVDCSVQHSRELWLSWFRGGRRLRQTSRPDLSSMLHLALLIQSSDEGEYRCVAENPVDQKSSTLDTADTCLNHGEGLSWCDAVVTVRLVLSAVLGLALILLVVDYIRFSRQNCRDADSRLITRRKKS